jgi:hypothetical protein
MRAGVGSVSWLTAAWLCGVASWAACGGSEPASQPDAGAPDASAPDVATEAGPDVSAPSWSGWSALSTIAVVGVDDVNDQLLHSTAADVKQHLDAVTGRTWSVVDGDVQGPALRLDVSATAPELAGKNDQAYRLVVDARGIRILGATTMATMHGAYDVMRRAGFRWFFPHAAWEVSPASLEDLTPTDQVLAPRFEYRALGQGNSDEIHAWQRHNRFAVPRVFTARQLWDYIPNVASTTWKDLYAANSPAVCTNQNGNKTQVFPNVDDPTMWSMSEQFCKKQLDNASVKDGTTQEQATCDYSPSDGLRTYCDSWFQKDNGGNVVVDTQVVTDHLYDAFNAVGHWVGQTYPGKYAGVLSYANFANVPSTEVDPSVYVALCSYSLFSGASPRLTFGERIAGFAENHGKRNLRLGTYEFVDDWAYSHDHWKPKLLDGVTSRIRFVADQKNSVGDPSVRDFFSEATKNWVPLGLVYYTYAQLTFDPTTDPKVLVDDFFARAFGPASAVMRRFYDRLNTEAETDRVWGLSFRDLGAALTAAGADAAVAERVRHVLYWTYYMWKWGRVIQYGSDNGLISHAALQNEVLPYLSRISTLGVLNAGPTMGAIESNLLNLTLAQVKALKLPTNPFSPQEAAALLDAANATYASQTLIDPPIVDPATISLVPAGANAPPSQPSWSGADVAEVLVPASAGETLSVGVSTTNPTSGYLSWYAPSGALLANQKVTRAACPGNAPCTFSFTAAAAGLYRLEVATATLQVTLAHPASVDVRNSTFTRGGTYYFQIAHPNPLVLAWSGSNNGVPITVTDPNGKPTTIAPDTDASFQAPAVGRWSVTIPQVGGSPGSFSIFGAPPLVWYDAANVLTSP